MTTSVLQLRKAAIALLLVFCLLSTLGSQLLTAQAQPGIIPQSETQSSVFTNRLMINLTGITTTNRLYYTTASATFGPTNNVHVRTNATAARWEWHSNWSTVVATNDSNRPTGTWRAVAVGATLYGYSRYEPHSSQMVAGSLSSAAVPSYVTVDADGVIVSPTNFAEANNLGKGETTYNLANSTNLPATSIAAGTAEINISGSAASANQVMSAGAAVRKRGTNLTHHATLTNACANSLPGDEIILSGQHELYVPVVLTNITLSGDRTAIIYNYVSNSAAIVPDRSLVRSLTFTNAGNQRYANQISLGSFGPSGQVGYTNGLVRDCVFYSGGAYGIYSRETSSSRLNNLDVYDSQFIGDYAGAASDGYDRMRLWNCTFRIAGGTNTYALEGFGISVGYGFTSEGFSTNELHNCSFYTSGATNGGVAFGIYIIETTQTLIDGCNFYAQTTTGALQCDGINISGDGFTRITGGNIIQAGGTEGSGIYVQAGTPTVSVIGVCFQTTNTYIRNEVGTLAISGGSVTPAEISAPTTGVTWLNYGTFTGNGSALTNLNGVFEFALSAETTAFTTTGTAKVTWRAPFTMTVTDVRASLTTASSSGIPTVDINEDGTTILSTKLTIDANEKTSTTAAVAAAISDTVLADDAEITFDIDVAGTGAAGLKVRIYYRR